LGRISNAALENRNKFIEWAHGIVTLVLFGALVSPSASLILGWLASAFVSVIVMAFFSIATIQHGFFVRFNAIRSSVLSYVKSKGTVDQESRFAYAQYLADVYDVKGLNSGSRRHLIWSVFKLGFGYLIVASFAALVYFSAIALSSTMTGPTLDTIFLTSSTPCAINSSGLAFMIIDLLVLLAIVREMRFLATTPILNSCKVERYEKWVKENSPVLSTDSSSASR